MRREFFSGIPEQLLSDVESRQNAIRLITELKKSQLSLFTRPALSRKMPELSSLYVSILENKKKEYDKTIRYSTGGKVVKTQFVKNGNVEIVLLSLYNLKNSNRELKSLEVVGLCVTTRSGLIIYQENTDIAVDLFRRQDEQNTYGAIVRVENVLKKL